MSVFKTILFLIYISVSHQLNNGLGRIPQMGTSCSIKTSFFHVDYSNILGWNSWNHFHCNINENLIKETADYIVATGLAAAGYQYGNSFHLFKYYFHTIVFLGLLSIQLIWMIVGK